ncbi:MAG TPA: FkbM family methyltransferase [Polyangiaceae bacterium]|nr:FkbM family methyltransferase [Polyangiaceae bacterium]
MPMISYAQNAEDVRLRRAFAGQGSGYYVDIGAYDPVSCSITKHFYDKGWRGLNVDASPANFKRVSEGRPHDDNVNVGVSDVRGTLTFYDSATATAGLSTFSAEEAVRHRATGVTFVEREVPVVPLAELLAARPARTIDFMSIDVEGHERQVLLGADLARFRPRVLIVEATRPRTTTPVFDKWEPLILSADYVFACFDGLNRYYVRREDVALVEPLSLPPNTLDDYVPYVFFQEIERLKRGIGHPLVTGSLKATAWLKNTLEEKLKSPTEPASAPDVASAAARILGESAVVVLHVGAGRNAEGAWYRRPPITRFYAFDPDEAECARLNAALTPGSPDRFVPVLLSDVDGTTRLHRARAPECSSPFEPNADLARRYPLLGVIDPVGESDVSTRRLETWASAEGVTDPSFVKIGAHGSTLGVLEGAGSRLDECLGLEIEVEFMPLHHGSPLFSDVDQWLRKRGFWLWRLDHRVHYSERHTDALPREDVAVFDDVPSRSKAGAGRLSWAHALYFRDHAELPLRTRKDAERLLKLAVLLEAASETDGAAACVARLLAAPGLLEPEERALLSRDVRRAPG